MTIAIILAAGVGSRLRPLTDTKPKCCVAVGGSTLLERLLGQLSKSCVVEKIFVVAGYKVDNVKEVIESGTYESEVILIENPVYDKTNNMYSCDLALQYSIDEQVIIVNADCIYDDYIVQKMCNVKDSAIAIDTTKYSGESMKVALHDGNAIEMSKALLESRNVSVSIDLYTFNSEDVGLLKEIIRARLDSGDNNSWTEVAINELCKKQPISTVDFGGLKWVEIDNHEDLKLAETLWT